MNVTINKIMTPIPTSQKSVTLLAFLRHTVGLKGTKYGCGQGLCGACTVHLNGKAVRSCQTLVEEVADQEITTIEGLAETSETVGLHPLQQAWIQNSVPQCGYCQPGQLMSAAALLASNAQPSTNEIREGMRGNLCRCGTYPRIQAAIKSVSLNLNGGEQDA